MALKLKKEINEIDKLLKQLYNFNFGVKRKIISNSEKTVNYSELKIGDHIIAVFSPYSQKYLNYATRKEGILIYKDPDDPSQSIINIDLDNPRKYLKWFNKTNDTNGTNYTKRKIVKQSKQDILDQSKDNEIENLFDDINMSNSGVYYYIKIEPEINYKRLISG